MGGFGSGRHGGKQMAEHCRKLDINKLLQAGCLKSGYFGGWQWLEDGERVANIEFYTVGNKITLKYRFRSNGVNERLKLTLFWHLKVTHR